MSTQVPLSERAMLVAPHIKMWQGRRLDRPETKAVNERHGLVAVATVRKSLLPNPCPEYATIQSAASASRAYHYEFSLPWGDEGARIILATAWMDYREAMDGFESQFWGAVDGFMTVYPSLRDDAPTRLSGLFRDEDWPSVSRLRESFAWTLDVRGISSASDFRVGLADGAQAEIRASIRASESARVEAAMADAWRRVYDATTHLAGRLAGTGTCDCSACGGREVATDRLTESSVENLRAMAAVLPRLNLTGDEALAARAESLQSMLRGIGVEDLRRSEALRTQLAEAARLQAVGISDEAPAEAPVGVRRRMRSLVSVPEVAPEVVPESEIKSEEVFHV